MGDRRVLYLPKTIILLACVLSFPAHLSAQGSTGAQAATKGPLTMNVTVGAKTFAAQMLDNETTRAFMALLPMTVNMSELNGNEKYYRLPNDLPTKATERPATIYAGEIMCWSSSNLVLFYSTFSNSYSGYVRLGRIEDISGFASALGPGSVQVTFSASE